MGSWGGANRWKNNIWHGLEIAKKELPDHEKLEPRGGGFLWIFSQIGSQNNGGTVIWSDIKGMKLAYKKFDKYSIGPSVIAWI